MTSSPDVCSLFRHTQTREMSEKLLYHYTYDCQMIQGYELYHCYLGIGSELYNAHLALRENWLFSSIPNITLHLCTTLITLLM